MWYKVPSVFHMGFGIAVKKLRLTVVVTFVVKDAAEALFLGMVP